MVILDLTTCFWLVNGTGTSLIMSKVGHSKMKFKNTGIT